MPAEAERRAICCELVSEVARHAGEVRLKLTGTSMLPAMWPGDVVTVQRCHLTDLRPGHIVLYRADGNLVAHRVLRVFPDRLIARGDSVPCSDPPIQPSAIVGFVTAIVRDRRAINTRQTWRHRALAALLRHSHLWLRITLHLGIRINARTRPAASFATSEMQ